MRCVILQPSYIPWRGYFHQIQKADVFVYYDDVQFDKHGWRNRNRIKSPQGSQWLTIPVHSKGNVVERTAINQILMCNNQNWARKHWATLKQVYGKTPYFNKYASQLEDFYSQPPELLSDFTIALTIHLASSLGLERTRFVRSSALGAPGQKTDRLVSILQAVGATHYISGPSARAYLEEEKLRAAGIGLEYMAYDYPPYPQLSPPFDPQISLLDLLFMTGPEAGTYIWGHRASKAA
jgi:hypothetical protein